MSADELTTDASLPLAVLISGGLDSAVLLADAIRRRPAVHPLYVRCGLAWEAAEQAHLERFLAAVACPALRPVVRLDVPAGDLYGDHWSMTGAGVPGADSGDEEVYLPGRNVLLLGKAMIWCHLHAVPAVALATLEANPFPDATAGFIADYEAVVNRGLGGRVRVLRPFEAMGKAEVLRRAAGVPLEWTLSCLRPLAGGHCGACNKCAERQRGFRQAGVPDPTPYGRRQ